jgi:hypothetical protein
VHRDWIVLFHPDLQGAGPFEKDVDNRQFATKPNRNLYADSGNSILPLWSRLPKIALFPFHRRVLHGPLKVTETKEGAVAEAWFEPIRSLPPQSNSLV